MLKHCSKTNDIMIAIPSTMAIALLLPMKSYGNYNAMVQKKYGQGYGENIAVAIASSNVLMTS